MKNLLKNIVLNLLRALDNRPGGFSARKLSAFVTMLCVIYLHIHYVDATVLVSVLFYDMLFILLLLGLITVDQLYKFKNGGNNSTPPKDDKPNDTEVSDEQSNNTNQNDIG